MARVEIWFGGFVQRLVQRMPRDNWPDGASEYWDVLRSAIVRHGVTEPVADEASLLLAESPPKFIDQLLPDLLKKIREVWARSEVTPDAPSEREAAERLSRECDDCGGKTGVTLRWRRKSIGTHDSSGRPNAPYIVLFCRCPMGRWTEKRIRETAPEIRKRFYDLDDHPWLWAHEYRQPPEIGSDQTSPRPSGAGDDSEFAY